MYRKIRSLKKKEITKTAKQTSQQPSQQIQPMTDIIEIEDGIAIIIDIPGVPSENISLELNGDFLILDAQMKLDSLFKKDPNEQIKFMEFFEARYYLSITLSKNLNSDTIQSFFKNGTLMITIEYNSLNKEFQSSDKEKTILS